MEKFKHPLCNTFLGAPTGQEGEVNTLPIMRGTFNGVECVRSFWRPTFDELSHLANGGCVVLTVLGKTHAPLRVDAIMGDEGDVPTTPH